MPAFAAVCANHPQREASGICVACRTQVCSECSTKVDGINYCVACLGRLGPGQSRVAEASPQLSATSASIWLAMSFATLVLATWALLEAGLFW